MKFQKVESPFRASTQSRAHRFSLPKRLLFCLSYAKMLSMEELNKIIANNLVQLRLRSGLTQLQVAEKINYSDKSVSKWERGESIPDVSVLLQLANLYGVSIDDMVHKHEKKAIKPKRFKISQHMLICIIAFSAVWFLATIAFAVVYGMYNIYDKAWLSFIVAIPVSFLVLMIFSFCWYPYFVTAIFCSVFLWTTVLAITLCINTVNMWLLYIIVVPLQLIVIFGFVLNMLLNKNKKKLDIEQKEPLK